MPPVHSAGGDAAGVQLYHANTSSPASTCSLNMSPCSTGAPNRDSTDLLINGGKGRETLYVQELQTNKQTKTSAKEQQVVSAE